MREAGSRTLLVEDDLGDYAHSPGLEVGTWWEVTAQLTAGQGPAAHTQ